MGKWFAIGGTKKRVIVYHNLKKIQKWCWWCWWCLCSLSIELRLSLWYKRFAFEEGPRYLQTCNCNCKLKGLFWQTVSSSYSLLSFLIRTLSTGLSNSKHCLGRILSFKGQKSICRPQIRNLPQFIWSQTPLITLSL